MKKIYLAILLLTVTLLSKDSISIEVLGSGGPEIGDKRASSAYLIWIDGKSRVLIDFGAGAMLRFEESDAKIEDLDIILLTHLHIDHTADIPSLLKASFFVDRDRALRIFGPDSNDMMPSTTTFIDRLFATGVGAWQYMGDYLDGRSQFALKPYTIKMTKKPKVIYRKDGISISTISVHHGPIPALAYRIDIGKHSITISGDMNGSYHTLEKLAKGSDILIAHNAIPQNATGIAADLHMTPLTIGLIAQKADVGRLVLSHRMKRTLGRETDTLREINRNYKGKILFANDKDSYPIF